MASGSSWGDDIPEMLRNNKSSNATFTADGQQWSGVNRADWLARLKPLDNVSDTFVLKQRA